MSDSKPLTPKQQLFCEEYLIDLNATQAAIRAGYSVGTAKEIGCQNLTKVNIQQKLTALMAERSARVEITADMVLKELASIGFARVDDFVRVVEIQVAAKQTEGDDPKLPTKYKMVEVKPTSEVAANKIAAIASIKQGTAGIEVKMHDKVKALELMGKHMAMWTDNLNLGGHKDNPVLTEHKVTFQDYGSPKP